MENFYYFRKGKKNTVKSIMNFLLLQANIPGVIKSILITGVLLSLFSNSVIAQRQIEELKRGLVAVQTGDNDVFLSWRLLGTDDDSVAFNLYRNDTKLNETPIKTRTNYVDNEFTAGDTYHVFSVLEDIEQTSSDTIEPWNQNYLSIPLNIPPGGTVPGGGSYTYSANDVSVADLTGNGVYDIVLKWDPSNSRDNANTGYSGNQILDGYTLEGEHLWRIDLGINIRAGAHYTQFMVYDLDGNGKAEIAVKTAPGSKDATGNYISLGPAATTDHEADYRNSSGRIIEGPEFFTIYSGETGIELATTDYIPFRGPTDSLQANWGDGHGNRVDRFLAAIAYLDGERPSVVMCRGYYAKSVLAAWNWRDGELTHVWTFDSNNYPGFGGQGNHNLSVADVDGDGFDEIIYGHMAVNHDGTGLWTTGMGHGDAMHVTDIDPTRPGLEKWGITEPPGTPGSQLLDAATGEILWETPPADIPRGVAANLHPGHHGLEVWGGTTGLYNSKGIRVGPTPSSANHVIWWDGELTRELLNDITIRKYQGDELLFIAEGCASINGSKANPNLQADLFGDWREEVIFRTLDNTELRIFTTTIPTEYRIPTLMHDHVYRMGIAWQNVAYNQPPHTGYYFGPYMFTPDSLIPPSTPINFSLLAWSDTVSLRWDKNYEGDRIAGYNLYRSKDMDGPFELINTGLIDTIVFVDTNVENDTVYYYTITAVDTLDNESMFYDYLMAIPTERPDVPSDFYARKDIDAVGLYWNAINTSDVIGYNVYRKSDIWGDFEKLNQDLLTGNFYIDEELNDTTIYYYSVTSVDAEMKESFFAPADTAYLTDEYTLQIEDGEPYGTHWIQNEHFGFNGIGFLNFDDNNNGIDFNNIGGLGGGTIIMDFRYALGNNARNGNLVVNGRTQTITMRNTGAWTNWETDSIAIKLNPGFENTVRIAATGADLGNLDQVTFRQTTYVLPDTPDDPEIPTDIDNLQISKSLDITQNYPNPFSDYTRISYTINEPGMVRLNVYNIYGQLVRTLVNETHSAGNYEVEWNARGNSGQRLPEGVYIYTITNGNERGVMRKMMLIGR